MEIEVRILDGRLPGWGFPHWGSAAAAGLDLHACLPEPLTLLAGGPPVLIEAGFALRIGDPDWCAVIAPRSGLGHRGLVLGNTVGVIDADYEGAVTVSAWNRNPPGGDAITLRPGDRLAQLVLLRTTRPSLRVVESFPAGPAAGRGTGGFGSTGLAAPGPTPVGTACAEPAP